MAGIPRGASPASVRNVACCVILDGMEQETLRDLLTERDIRMDAAAMLAGVSTSTISRICSGAERARPKTVTSLAKALRVSARRMQALCNASYEVPRQAAAPQWTVWAWNEQINLWVQVDEGSEEDMKQSLARMQAAAGRFAMSEKGEPLPAPPADLSPLAEENGE